MNRVRGDFGYNDVSKPEESTGNVVSASIEDSSKPGQMPIRMTSPSVSVARVHAIARRVIELAGDTTNVSVTQKRRNTGAHVNTLRGDQRAE